MLLFIVKMGCNFIALELGYELGLFHFSAERASTSRTLFNVTVIACHNDCLFMVYCLML